MTLSGAIAQMTTELLLKEARSSGYKSKGISKVALQVIIHECLKHDYLNWATEDPALYAQVQEELDTKHMWALINACIRLLPADQTLAQEGIEFTRASGWCFIREKSCSIYCGLWLNPTLVRAIKRNFEVVTEATWEEICLQFGETGVIPDSPKLSYEELNVYRSTSKAVMPKITKSTTDIQATGKTLLPYLQGRSNYKYYGEEIVEQLQRSTFNALITYFKDTCQGSLAKLLPNRSKIEGLAEVLLLEFLCKSTCFVQVPYVILPQMTVSWTTSKAYGCTYQTLESLFMGSLNNDMEFYGPLFDSHRAYLEEIHNEDGAEAFEDLVAVMPTLLKCYGRRNIYKVIRKLLSWEISMKEIVNHESPVKDMYMLEAIELPEALKELGAISATTQEPHELSKIFAKAELSQVDTVKNSIVLPSSGNRGIPRMLLTTTGLQLLEELKGSTDPSVLWWNYLVPYYAERIK